MNNWEKRKERISRLYLIRLPDKEFADFLSSVKQNRQWIEIDRITKALYAPVIVEQIKVGARILKMFSKKKVKFSSKKIRLPLKRKR